MKSKEFLKECKDREVVKLLSVYVVSSWVLLQVLTLIQQPLGLPERSVTFLIIILFICFPIYIFLIWKFSVVKISKDKSLIIEKESKKITSFKKIYFTGLSFVIFLCALSVLFIFQNNFAEAGIIKIEHDERDKIAVLRFGNNTGDQKYDIIGKMAADWIIHGITENQVAQVISPEIISEYSSAAGFDNKMGDDQKMVEKYFKPGKIITGNYYLNGEELYFQCSLIEGGNKDIIMSFKDNECSLDMPLNCIEDLKQVILTYLTTQERPELSLQEQPPKFEAYQHLLNAKSNFGDVKLYLDLLNKAIAIDSTYFEPKVLRVAYYYNQGEYTKADSLRNLIVPHSINNSRQMNLLNMYNYLLEGNNKKVYNTLLKEYNIAPFDLQTNSSAMVLALQFVNRPEDVAAIYNAVDMTPMDVESCRICKDRYYINGLANVALKKHKDVIKLLSPLVDQVDDMYLKKPLMSAYARSRDSIGLHKLLANIALKNDHKSLLSSYIYLGKEYLLLNEQAIANSYFTKSVEEAGEQESNFKALGYFYLKNFKDAETLFKNVSNKDPKDLETLTKLAISNYNIGKTNQAEILISKLDTIDAKYQFGTPAYLKAQYYGAIGDETKSMNYLLKAVSDGYYFTSESYENDPLLKPFFKTNAFKNILTYWH